MTTIRTTILTGAAIALMAFTAQARDLATDTAHRVTEDAGRAAVRTPTDGSGGMSHGLSAEAGFKKDLEDAKAKKAFSTTEGLPKNPGVNADEGNSDHMGQDEIQGMKKRNEGWANIRGVCHMQCENEWKHKPDASYLNPCSAKTVMKLSCTAELQEKYNQSIKAKEADITACTEQCVQEKKAGGAN